MNVKRGEAEIQHAIVSAENEKVGKEKSIGNYVLNHNTIERKNQTKFSL